MGLIKNLANAWGALTGAKTLSPDMQAWVTGLDVPDNDHGAKLVSPYMQSAWIYTAVSALAESVSQIPFRISRVGADGVRQVRALRGSPDPRHREIVRRNLGENIVESGDVVDLFNQPHPSMGRSLFWEMVASWDALRGEFFIVPLDDSNEVVDLGKRSARVSRMLTLDTAMFWHIVIGYELSGWRYTGSPLMSPLPSEILSPTEVVHSRNVNPYLYWRGMSPLLVAMLPASADYAAEMFQKGLLLNNADTGIIATTDQNLTPEQREQFMAALRERKRKAGTPDRPLFLSSGVKIEKPTISNVDMQFLETRKLLRQEIGAIFKVPESIMGFSESKSSALSGGGNALNEEKLTFVQQTLTPKCHRYEAALDPIVKSFDPGLVGWFDIESLPVMQAARMARVDTATKVFGMGVPFNDINKVYDLGFPELEWGDKGYLPFNLQPADAMGQDLPGEDEPTDPTEANEGNEEPMKAMRRLLGGLTQRREGAETQLKQSTKLLWERHVRARSKTVKIFQGKVNRVLNEFRGKALAKLGELHFDGKTITDGAHGVTRPTIKGLVDLIFNAGAFGHELQAQLDKPIRGALQEAGDEALKEVGVTDPWKMPPGKAVEFLSSRTQSILGVGETVRERVNTTLEEGVTAGESTSDLAGRVREVFNEMTESESLRVARTETNIAFNSARHDALGDAGIEYKAWLSSHGPNVRDGHAEAEDETMDEPIAIDEPFQVMSPQGEMEELMFPGDDSMGASASNVINCQCVQIAAKKEGEDEEKARYYIWGLGSISFNRRGAKSAEGKA